MADDVSITFSAQIGQLISGVENIKQAIASIAQPVNDIKNTFSGLAEVVGVGLSVDGIKDFVEQMAEMGQRIEGQSAILGLSTTSIQELGFVAKATGGDADGLVKTMGLLQVNLEKAQTGVGPAANALKALGLSAKDLAAVPVDQQMIKLADAFNKYADGGKKAALANELVRGGAAALLPEFENGGAGIKKLTAASVEFGEVMSTKTVKALGQLDQKVTIAKGSLTTLGGELVALSSKELGDVSTWVASTAAQFTKLAEAGMLNTYVTTALSSSYDIFSANVEKAKTAIKDFFAPAAQYAADMAAADAKIEAMEHKRAADLGGMVDQSVAAYKRLAAAAAESNKPPAPSSAGPNKDALNASMEAAQEQIKAADSVYQQQVELYNSQFKMHEMTESQKTAATLAALDVRYGAELVASDKEIATYAVGTAGYQKALNERTQLTEKFAKDHQKIIDQAAEEEAKQWQKAADTLAGAFNSQLKGLLAGTTSWGHAMKNISADLVLKFIEDQVKLSVEFLANQARQLATTVATQAGMTSATTAGAAARSAAEMMSGETSILSVVANAMKSIFASAGQTSAEVAAWAAPYAGPAAPGIGAAAGAAVIGSSSALAMYDRGTDYVLKEGLGYLHPGEKVIPADVPMSRGSGPYTGGAGDSGGDVHVHLGGIHVSTYDGPSTKRFFDDNASNILNAVHKAAKRGAHLALQGAR